MFMQKDFRSKNHGTSWQKVAPWYNKITEGGQGHYYHQHVVLPGVMKLLNLGSNSKLLDLACGNGVLASSLPKNTEYLGIDLAADLVNQGRKSDQNPKHKYMVFDDTKELSIPNDFTHATIILALQNIRFPENALKNASEHLQKGGSLVIVLNLSLIHI